MSRQDSRRVDENELITRAREGDTHAFGILYERHAGAIYRFFCAHLETIEDAEDLTMDVFIHTWGALPTYKDQGFPFQAFLFKVARNILIDHYRQKRTAYALDEEMVDISLADPEQEAVESGERRRMQRVLGKLRDDYGLVLSLRFFSGLSAREIAQVMSRSEEAVRVLQFRALQALRKLIADEAIDEGK